MPAREHFELHQALDRLARALDDSDEGGPSEQTVAVLHTFLDKLSKGQAKVMATRLANLTRALEQLGPSATVEELAHLASAYERGLN